ncbi:MAG: hypothetical protein AB1598_00985 [Thermodesulfobacteriota bacterium]
MKIRSLTVIITLLIFGVLLSPATGVAQQEDETGVVLKPSPDVISKAENPSPPPDAKEGSSIGEDGMTVNTQNSPRDTDFLWIQEIDTDGNGDMESANLIWDGEDKILYFYYEGDFKCKNGKTAKGAALIGVNGKDNPRNKPAGSGFYAVSLDKGECGAEEAGLWGCRFDTAGNPTVCGVVGLDDKYDDIVILTASE